MGKSGSRTTSQDDGRQGAAESGCAIGLLALASDRAIESEMRQMLPADGTSLHVARLASPDRYDLATLGATETQLAEAAAAVGTDVALDALAYGCTSGTAAIGEERVLGQLAAARPGVPATTPITAALAALARIGARRVALLTPYPAAVHRTVLETFAAGGIDIVAERALGIAVDPEISRVTTSELRDALRAMSWRSADAIFLSCTALRVAAVIAALEEEFARPVLASNQVLVWHCLALAGRPPADRRFGRLMAR